MAIREIDIAKESSIQEVLKAMTNGGGGVNVSPSYNDYDYEVITIPGITGADCTSIVNCKGTVYFIADEGTKLGKYDYTSGTTYMGNLPYKVDVHESNLVTFHDEIHLLGGRDANLYSHFKWDGSSWKVASALPIPFCGGKAIVFNNELHIIGGDDYYYATTYSQSTWANKHYKWDGETWLEASVVPTDYNTRGCTLFVYGGKLHVIGGTTINGTEHGKKHYIWDTSSWSTGSELPSGRHNATAVTIEYNGTEFVYIAGGIMPGADTKITTFWKVSFDDPNYTFEEIGSSPIPTDGLTDSPQGMTVFFNKGTDSADLIIAGKRFFRFIKYTDSPFGGVWKCEHSFGSFNNGIALIDNNNVFHVFNQYAHHTKTESGVWNTITGLSYDCTGACAVVINDKIHLIGATNESFADYHRVWDGSSWETLPNLPFKLTDGYATVYNNEIHVINNFGSSDLGQYNHYKLLGEKWVPVNRIMDKYDSGTNTRVYSLVNVGDCLYTIYAKNNTEENTNVDICIMKYDGTTWEETQAKFTDVPGADATIAKYQLVLFNNRLTVVKYINTASGSSVTPFVILSDNDNAPSGNKLAYTTIFITGSSTMTVALGESDRLWFVSNSTETQSNCRYISRSIPTTEMMNVWIPKGHIFYCDKSYFLPITPQMEEVDGGYKSLYDANYVIYDASNKKASYSIG